MRFDEPWDVLLAVVVATLAVTRATRLVVDDTYPPIEHFREWFVNKVPDEWGPLVECPWCSAPYLALPAVAWLATLFAFPDWTANIYIWWIVNGWAAISWLAAFLTVRDIPPDQR